MSRTNNRLHRVYPVLYFGLLGLVGAYTAVNATYTAIIGGSPFYFFAVCVLGFQLLLAFRDASNQRHSAIFGLVILVIGLIYTFGLGFIAPLKAIVLLPSICLSLFGFSYFQSQSHRNALKTMLIIALLIMAAAQFYQLDALKGYYDSIPQQGSWQQYGAL